MTDPVDEVMALARKAASAEADHTVAIVKGFPASILIMAQECRVSAFAALESKVRELEKDAARYRMGAHGNCRNADGAELGMAWVTFQNGKPTHVLWVTDQEVDAAIAAKPTLVCQACGADRFKEDCKGNRTQCPITGTAAIDSARGPVEVGGKTP